MSRRTATRTDHPRRGTGRGLRGTDTSTLAVVGAVCAVAGFWVLTIVLGPIAVVCGWLAMGRRLRGPKPLLAVFAFALGAVDTLMALLYMTQ